LKDEWSQEALATWERGRGEQCDTGVGGGDVILVRKVTFFLSKKVKE
jgi:hypothetical protein